MAPFYHNLVLIERIDPDVPRRFGNLELLARQVVEGFITGLHKSPFHGFSVEFAEHRIYNPGESTRYIDWKLYARTEKLFVKRYEEETNLRCQLVIDNSSSMYFPAYGQGGRGPSKIGFSVEAAAAIAFLLQKQRDAVGLSIISDRTELHTQARSSSLHHKVLLSHLERIYQKENFRLNKTSDTANLLHYLADNIHKRSLVVIFSDMLDNEARPEALYSALQHLRHNKHEVILFHVFDKSRELDFSYDHRPLKFVDMETGRELKLNPADVKKRYVEQMNRYFHDIRLKCMQYHVDFVPSDIDEGFEKVLLSMLLKRSRMH